MSKTPTDKELEAAIGAQLSAYLIKLLKGGKASEIVKSITTDEGGEVRIELEDIAARCDGPVVTEIGVLIGATTMKAPRRLALTKRHRRR